MPSNSELLLQRFKGFLKATGNDTLANLATEEDVAEVLYDAVNDAIARRVIPQEQADFLASYLILRMFPNIPNKFITYDDKLDAEGKPIKDAKTGEIIQVPVDEVERPVPDSQSVIHEAFGKLLYAPLDFGPLEDPGRYGFAKGIEQDILSRNLTGIYESINTDWGELILADPKNYKSKDRLAEVIRQSVQSGLFMGVSILDDPNDPANVPYMDYLRDKMPEFNQRAINSGILSLR